MKDDTERYWEIDALRGIAIIGMIAFHFAFAVNYFGKADLNLTSIPVLFFSKLIPIIFLFLVGVSLSVSYARVHFLRKKEILSKFILRGLGLFCLGVILTVITYFIVPKEFVVFGILHLIGISVILGIFFMKSETLSLISAAIILIVGLFINSLQVSFNWLAWLGLASAQFASLDYFPLLPWFGIVLIGIAFGSKIYAGGQRSFNFIEHPRPKYLGILSFLGRNSLIIYFLQFPAILLIAYLI